jgi:hypothetical protein
MNTPTDTRLTNSADVVARFLDAPTTGNNAEYDFAEADTFPRKVLVVRDNVPPATLAALVDATKTLIACNIAR